MMQGRFLRTGPVKAVVEERGWRVKLGQNPLIFAPPDCFHRSGGELQIGRGISIFIEFRELEVSPNECAVRRAQLALWRLSAVAPRFAELCFHFLEGKVRQGDDSRSSQRHLCIGAMAEKGRESKCAVLQRHLFKEA